MMGIEIKETLDGSHTLYNSEVNDHYHSVNGALGESKHIFIRYGLHSLKGASLSVFEIGFGTGLNALLTALEAQKMMTRIKYTSIEKYPLAPALVSGLNYPQLLGGESSLLYDNITAAPWGEDYQISDHFTIHKIEGDIISFCTDLKYDIVYFDAFGPDKQPALWSSEVISKVCDSIRMGGIFVTYSAKGDLKRILGSNGFRVEHLPGPPGKREITRATRERE